MLGVIIHWDHKPKLDHIGKRNLFQHYDYVCRAYKVDKLVIVDVNGTMDLSPPHRVVATLEEAVGSFPEDVALCVVHPDAETRLSELTHLPDMIYLMGADYERLDYVDGHYSVRIPVADPRIELWADQALAIVLADRFTRS